MSEFFKQPKIPFQEDKTEKRLRTLEETALLLAQKHDELYHRLYVNSAWLFVIDFIAFAGLVTVGLYLYHQ